MPDQPPPLTSWLALNAYLQHPQATEEHVRRLLDDELAGRRRRTFLLRIHSRYNKLRADRERAELSARSA